MRLTSSGAYSRPPPVPKMPLGLVELMDGLARDVLKHNPTNVYEFCAKHMEKLLELRDGPSLKKFLTLEEKILSAQEKMRQKAHERRERFDKEIKLLSNNETIDDKTLTPVVSEDMLVAGPSLRAPVHHEVDLKNSSEVEISHVAQVDKVPFGELIDGSNIEEIDIYKEPQNLLTHNKNGDETRCDGIISDEKYGQEIETEENKKIDDEPLFGKVDIEVNDVELLKEPKLEAIVDVGSVDSHLQTITEASEEIFVSGSNVILPTITIGDDGCDPDNISHNIRRVEQTELVEGSTNTDVIEHDTETPEIHKEFENDKSNDIVDMENKLITPESTPEVAKDLSNFVASSDKDTVDGTSSENKKQNDDNINVSEITRKIDSPNLDIPLVLDLDIKGSYVGNLENDTDLKDTLEDKVVIARILIANTNVSEKEVATENDRQIINNLTDANIKHVDISTETKPDIKAETDVPHVNITTEYIPDIKAEANVHYGNIPTENKSDIKAETDVKHENMTTENKAHTETASQLENMTTEIKADIKTETGDQHVNMATGNKANINAGTDDEHESMIGKNEANLDVDSVNVNLTECRNNDSNIRSIDTAKIEPEIIQQALKLSEENLTNDSEKHDNTEISLQKSDSTENTNEDSISMVESDLSKTDDDCTQNPNMDLETAAVTIQKVFRSFMFKSRNSTFEDNANDEHYSVDEDNDKKEEYYAAANMNQERRPLGITRMDTVLQTVNEEKSLSVSTDDSSTLSSAATTIQAHVRGFLVRHRLNSSKTFSMNSLVNSHEVLEADPEHKNKTILNIHIVPEEGNYLSRDESLITSMDLSLDGSPPSSVNLHPLSCDISERRKMLKREDAVQSVSPPSNNSGKLSEDSVKDVLINENSVLEREPTNDKTIELNDLTKELGNEAGDVISSSTVTPITVITISKSEDPIKSPGDTIEATLRRNGRSLSKLNSDESDVVTPYVPSPRGTEDSTKLVHSGEFHDVVLPTKVSRNDTSAVRGE